MRSERESRRGGIFLVVLLGSGLLTVLHSRAARSGHADAVSGVVRDMALVPGELATAQVGQWWHLSAGSLFSGPRLARQNAALTARVLELSAQNKELLTEQAENIRLHTLLGFAQRSPRPLLAAQVVALKPNPHSDTVTVNRGSAQGVRPHSVILAPNGALVGQVLDVSPRSCDILLLTDAASSVGALVHNHTPHGPIGLCQGDGQGHLTVTYLRSDTLLHLGDAVTTSGLGGVFPRALPLGAVSSISVDKTRSLQTALLRPAADYDHLEEVFIIQDAVPETPPDTAPMDAIPPVDTGPSRDGAASQKP